jgi:uncharacterized protein YciI
LIGSALRQRRRAEYRADFTWLRGALHCPPVHVPGSAAMLFVIHAIDRQDAMPTRAKFYRDHRIHLDQAGDHHVDVATAGTLIADDGMTPCGSVFVIDAKDRATVDAFVRSDPYHVNGVWERVQIHGYSKKRGTPIVSRRGA